MGDNTGFAIFWLFVALVPFLIAQAFFGYWVFRSVELSKKFAKYLKSLLYINWAAIVAFYLVIVVVFVEVVRKLAIGDDFTKEFEDPNLQPTLLVATLCYIIGKWLVYFVLYLRLYYTLRKSAYCYNDRTYKTIKYLIVLEIVITLIATSLMIAADDGPLFILGQLFAIPFFLLDIGIPVSLNIMFIKKTYQVGKTYFRIASATRSFGTPGPTSKSKSASTKEKSKSGSGSNNLQVANQNSVNRAASVSDDDTSDKPRPQLSDNPSRDSNDGRTASTGGHAPEVSGSGAQVTGATSASGGPGHQSTISTESEKDLSELFDAISRVAILSGIIAGSSFIFFFTYGLSLNLTFLNPLLWIGTAIDCCFNLVCLVLAFEFAAKYYRLCCGCCQKCCSDWIAKRAEK